MFHIMFTWSQFTCYIILVLLLLALPWGFNVFYASVSSYRYICSKFIIGPMIHDRGSDMIGGVRAWSKGEYYCWRTRDRKGLCLCCVFILCCDLYQCCFCKLLGLFSCICRLLWFVLCLCSLYALFYLLCSIVSLVFYLLHYTCPFITWFTLRV